jgi:hypothetical protein
MDPAITRRPLESYGVLVLAEYIRRRTHFPAEIDRIEEELISATKDCSVVPCPRCKDGGAILASDSAAVWCDCPAATKLRAKEPEFVERWNARPVRRVVTMRAGVR